MEKNGKKIEQKRRGGEGERDEGLKNAEKYQKEQEETKGLERKPDSDRENIGDRIWNTKREARKEEPHATPHDPLLSPPSRRQYKHW